MRDKRGWLPVHFAIRFCGTELTVRTLLKAYPESLFERTNKGETLLGLAEMGTKRRPRVTLVAEIKQLLALHSV